MPYIAVKDREKFDLYLNGIQKIDKKGELEYCIFKLMKRYMKDKEYRYTQLHDTVYAANHCADEFRRRYLDSREDGAIIENGDVGE